MAPNFLSKFIKGNTNSNDTSAGHSRDRSVSNPKRSTEASPRTSFQFATFTSRSRASSSVALPSNSANNSTSAVGEAAEEIPPVPPLPAASTLSSPVASNSRSRRNSVSVIPTSGAVKPDLKKNDKTKQKTGTSGVPTITTTSPLLSISHANRSAESIATTISTQLGVTIIPPSPLLYPSSLASDGSNSQEDFSHTNSDSNQAKGQSNANNANQAIKGSGKEGASAAATKSGGRSRTTSVTSTASASGKREKPPGLDFDVKVDDTTNVGTPTPTPTTATTVKAPKFNANTNSAKNQPAPAANTNSNHSPKTNGMPPTQVAQTTNSSTLATGFELQRKSSSRSLTNVPAPIITAHYSDNNNGAGNGQVHHSRAATTPEGNISGNGSGGTENTSSVTMTPIVESPKGLDFPFSAPSTGKSQPTGSVSNLLSPRDNTDAASIISTTSKSSPKEEKKRPWKRSTTRKPTGLASAIAASGLAMANPSISAMHSAMMTAAQSNNISNSSNNSSNLGWKGSAPGSPPYMSKSPAASSLSAAGKSSRHKSGELTLSSPKSAKSKRSPSGKSPTSAGSHKSRHHRRTSVSAYSDAASSFNGMTGNTEYFSGAESEGGLSRISGHSRSRRRIGGEGSGSESGTGDESTGSSDDDDDDDDLDDLDLGDEDMDMPVTGFAVASNKRNADFHELFPGVPEGDYLIEDYGCALQREILIQGRLYISENHICFHANIFGWITDLSIPIYEIVSLEKKMTAFVIPNAIQIATRQAKYTFASFLSRDTTFDVIYNIWRLARPEDSNSIRSSGRGSMEGPGSVVGSGVAGSGGGASREGALPAIVGNGSAGGGGGVTASRPLTRKATQCACGREGRHYTETAMDVMIPGTPEMIHNLMFASGFIKDFMAVEQKLLDIQMSDWMPTSPGSKLLTRNMSYIKPLNGSLGPKQTKCEIKDETAHIDFNEYVSTVTTTRTPDVPSGGVFSVKTRTCIMWASPITSRVIVTTQVEWTGRSFIKGIIERSAIDGQKVYHSDLEKAMRKYIQEHQGEFIPEGMDASVLDVTPPAISPEPTVPAGPLPDGSTPAHPISYEERNKQREHERNQRAFQWAWDTFDGAFSVAKQSTKGALELVRDAWDQSSSTTILYFVIVILVISNLWTLGKMGKREEVGRRKEKLNADEKEKWVQSVVTALWEELAAGKREASGIRDGYGYIPGHANDLSGTHPPLMASPILVESSSAAPLTPGSWREEVAHLHQTLTIVEERLKTIKRSLVEFEKLDQLD